METQGSLQFPQEPATGPCRIQMCLVHNFPPYFPKINSNIILPTTPRSSERSHPYRISDQNFVRISHIYYVLHAPLTDLVTLIIFGEAYRYEAPHFAVFSSLLPLHPA
jgi:hypothetical protein